MLKKILLLTAATLFLAWSASHARAQQRQPGAAGAATRVGTGAYNPATTVGNATISIDPETRQLIIISDDETNVHIRDIIQNLDRPKPQVLIKVVFLEVTYRDDSDIGLEGTITLDKNRSTTQLESAFGIAAEARGGFARFLSDDLQVTLRALAERGKLEVLSRPSILTRNNQEAIIIVGQEVPFVQNTQVTFDGRTFNSIVYDDIGIILRVTPFIRTDGLVEMIVYPEISTITGETIPISDTLNAPVFAKRAAETVVLTNDGQTVVIGGLMENNKTESIRKIPLLGDIPGLGLLFRRTIKSNSKTELLIFLTPHVIYDPSQLSAMTRAETSRTRLLPQSFSDDELDRFLDGTTPENGAGQVIDPIPSQAPVPPPIQAPASGPGPGLRNNSLQNRSRF
jgi:type II secretory pathway component GspD/PulD (secretin)